VYADWPTLRLNIASLKRLYTANRCVDIHYINDCGPAADELEKQIKRSIERLPNFFYHRNSVNLGFLRNCNNAVMSLVDRYSDVLLLNSDTRATKGFIEEMERVLTSGTNIGVVSPRSNNATIWSVPMDGRFREQPERSFSYWKRLKRHLPESNPTPTAHGFCMLIRRSLIDEIGLFDEAFGQGYGEENDFTMRARERGWVCAAANHAYVFHSESKSFGAVRREKLRQKNHALLTSRYPDYDALIEEYLLNTTEPELPTESRVWRAVGKLYRIAEYAHTNGYRAATRQVCVRLRRHRGSHTESLQTADIYRTQVSPPSLKVWSHELSNTGAPLVLYDILKQRLSDNHTLADVDLFFPLGRPVEDTFVDRLHDIGLTPIGNSLTQQRFFPGDIILLNSSAYDPWFFDDLLTNIENGTIRHLFWYIHEADETFSPAFWDYETQSHAADVLYRYQSIAPRFRASIENGTTTIYAPSHETAAKWQAVFHSSKHLTVMPGRIMVEPDDFVRRPPSTFDTIRFVLVAGHINPNKGQLSVVHAIQCFQKVFYAKHPSSYRQFTVDIVGVTDNVTDISSLAIRDAVSSLGDVVKLHPPMPIDDIFQLFRQSNMSVTYSLKESFSMATMEAMAYGHPIIRSEASGVHEQLVPGVNGWAVSTKNWWGLVEAIEAALNRRTTTNETLAQMSAESVKLAKRNRNARYLILDDIDRFIAGEAHDG